MGQGKRGFYQSHHPPIPPGPIFWVFSMTAPPQTIGLIAGERLSVMATGGLVLGLVAIGIVAGGGGRTRSAGSAGIHEQRSQSIAGCRRLAHERELDIGPTRRAPGLRSLRRRTLHAVATRGPLEHLRIVGLEFGRDEFARGR